MGGDAAAFRHIGRRVPRREDRRLLRGEAQFFDDVPKPPGTLYMGCVRSTAAHADILRVDGTAATALPGVHAIFTGRDLAGAIKAMAADHGKKGFKSTTRDVMPADRVRYVGDTVAVVLAEDPYLLEDALDLVEVDYAELPAVIGLDEALAEGAPRLHPEIDDNVPFVTAACTEGFEQAFAAADLVVADTFTSTRMAGVSMEPRGCMAVWDRGLGALTLWSSTQVPHLLRSALSELLGLPESRLRVIAPDVGGGFGPKAHVYPEEIVAAAVARRTGRPIKWVGDRQDDFVTTTHARDYRLRLEMALSADGTILAVRNRLDVNIGAYVCFPFGANAETGGGAIYLPGAYRFAHYDYVARSVMTNKAPTGVYRGVAAPIAHMAAEGLLDRAAARLGLDPVELRRRNLLRPDEYPHVNAAGIRSDSGSHVECLRLALEDIGYEAFRRQQPEDRLRDGLLHGIGIVCITEHTGQGAARYRARGLHRVPGFEGVVVRIEPDGQVIAATSQATQGQGHLTVFAQVIAENLGVEPEDVTVMEGDTAVAPFGSGTFASRGAVLAGGAAQRASTALADKIRRIAAHQLEAAPADIELVGGRARVVGVPDMGISLREVAAIAHSMESRTLPPGDEYGLEAKAFYDPPGVVLANAVHAARVAVDPQTGRVQVLRYAVAHDCGRVINPMLVAGQVHGGIAQGLGQALMEGVVYDETGQLLTTQLLDYLLPTACDVPDITIRHVETPSADTLLGIKGAGEGGVIGSVPAIAAAVNDALAPYGAFVSRLPLSPETVLALIDGGRRP